MTSSDSIFRNGDEAFDRGDYESARLDYVTAEGQGSDRAALMLGWMYEAGCAVPSDPATAMHYYRRSASRGNSQAKLYLGRTLIHQRQETEGFGFLRDAAPSEPAAAYALGRAASLSLEERLSWLEHGVALGNVYCLALSGRLLLRRNPMRYIAKALWRIARAFWVTIFCGLAVTSATEIEEDRRFQK